MDCFHERQTNIFNMDKDLFEIIHTHGRLFGYFASRLRSHSHSYVLSAS